MNADKEAAKKEGSKRTPQKTFVKPDTPKRQYAKASKTSDSESNSDSKSNLTVGCGGNQCMGMCVECDLCGKKLKNKPHVRMLHCGHAVHWTCHRKNLSKEDKLRLLTCTLCNSPGY